MLSEAAVIILLSALCFASFFCFNWILRFYFVVQGFEKTGSMTRRRRAYSAQFSMLQRILLIPFFSACADKRKTQYIILGCMNYLHFVFALFSVGAYILERHNVAILYDWRINLYVLAALTCLEWIIVNYKKTE